MNQLLTRFMECLRSLCSGVSYDAFSRSPRYLHSQWPSARRCTPVSCEEETLEQLRDRWRV
ncbi:hypothetical protein [Chitinibacter sp. GC72]|uniref:hypothetical protein n=1 Tax=Chitinibacter sp. GC72 TaxID=1526917 RepID=UPI0012F7619C|nr:hypothetical protein [Chitinibacter sp. GC72]